MTEQELVTLKKRVGYDGKPQQFKYGFDLAIRGMQAAQQKWISIDESLPPYDKDGARPNYRLLVCLNTRTVSEASYWGNGEFSVACVPMKSVTHWMLLPDPPVHVAQEISHD